MQFKMHTPVSLLLLLILSLHTTGLDLAGAGDPLSALQPVAPDPFASTSLPSLAVTFTPPPPPIAPPPPPLDPVTTTVVVTMSVLASVSPPAPSVATSVVTSLVTTTVQATVTVVSSGTPVTATVTVTVMDSASPPSPTLTLPTTVTVLPLAPSPATPPTTPSNDAHRTAVLAGVLTPLLVLTFAGLGVAYWLAARRRERKRVDAVVRNADWYPHSARIRDTIRRWSGMWDPKAVAAKRRSSGPGSGVQRLGSETELPLWKDRARKGDNAAAGAAGNGDEGVGPGPVSASGSASGSGARVRGEDSGGIQIPRAVQDVDRVVRRQP